MPDFAAHMSADDDVAPVLRVSRGEGDAGVRVLRVEGEVDMASAPALDAALTALLPAVGRPRIVLDFSGVSHCDSSGIGVLLAFRRRLGPEGHLTLTGVADNVANTFRIAGIEGALEIATAI